MLKLALKFAAKPLLMETWLLLTTYWKSSSPCPRRRHQRRPSTT